VALLNYAKRRVLKRQSIFSIPWLRVRPYDQDYPKTIIEKKGISNNSSIMV
jgi:hypothetical protein